MIEGPSEVCLRGKGGGAKVVAVVVAEARRRSRRGRVSGARRVVAVLRSSRTAMSDDGWTRPPGSGQDGGVRRPADETDATPFPDVSPAPRRHPPRQQKCHRRATAAEAQQQKGNRSRKATAAEGSQRKEGTRVAAKTNAASELRTLYRKRPTLFVDLFLFQALKCFRNKMG